MILSLMACTEQPKQAQTVSSSEVVPTVESEHCCTNGTYQITITETLLYNDSVGSDWTKTYTCDGQSVTNGKQWTVPLNNAKTVKINVTFTENDKWPDIGKGYLSVLLADGFEASTIITVTENKGRYIGNTAQWKVTIRTKLIEKS